MLTLNLIRATISEIKYNIIEFSDGEPHITLEKIDRKVADFIRIVTRISSLKDLFLLQQVGDVLNRQEIPFALEISYLLGMRMDRVMDFERPYTLKIVTETINNLHPNYVSVIEPHSDKTKQLLKNYVDYSPWDIYNLTKDYRLIFPDAGAKKRYAYLDKTNAVTCSKIRDIDTGVLCGFSVDNPKMVKDSTKKYIIVDDLCDGGGTFIGIAEKLREINPNIDLSIAVTHAVNRVGINKLANTFNKVFITNTYKDWDNVPDNVNVIHLV